MSVNVSCVGKLAELCPQIELNARTPEQVIGLMEANFPGFRRQLILGNYGMVMYTGEGEATHAHGVTEAGLAMPLSNENIVFVPVPKGEVSTATFWLTSQIVTYTGVTTMTGVYLAAAVAAVVVAVGVSLALSGLAKLIMPETPEGADNVTGYQFNGPVNTSKQGAPVPLCYGGPILVGSQVISVALATEDIPV